MGAENNCHLSFGKALQGFQGLVLNIKHVIFFYSGSDSQTSEMATLANPHPTKPNSALIQKPIQSLGNHHIHSRFHHGVEEVPHVWQHGRWNVIPE